MLEVRALHYQYPGGIQALQDISFSAQRGSKLFFHGPNGAGKTTLFQCINGLLKPAAGTVLLEGNALAKERDRIGAIGIVFQNPDDQLICGSVFDEVAFGPLHLGLEQAVVRDRTAWAMESMGISDLADRPPHLLSFGQKRRVTIAAVLSMGQDVLLLDEPTAGLDARQSLELVTILDQLAAAGKTLLISTHDADFSFRCADKIAVLENGRLLGFGEPVEVFSNRNLLAQAGLEPPAALAVYQALLEKGVINESTDIPRNLPDILSLIL